MSMQMTLPQGTSFTDTELALLKRAGERQQWVNVTVSRKSEREFDLKIDGTCKIENEGPYHFGAWLPLSVLNIAYYDRELCQYVDDDGTGDWSFVRDADEKYIWTMFNDVRRKV